MILATLAWQNVKLYTFNSLFADAFLSNLALWLLQNLKSATPQNFKSFKSQVEAAIYNLLS